MKSYTLTIHYGVNYGSVLQTFAMQQILRQKGVENKVINYIPEKYNLWKEFVNDKKGKYPFIIIVFAFLLKFPGKYKSRKIFSDFLKRNVNMTVRISNSKLINNFCDGEALFIVGSDQVWNFDYNTMNDNTYLFDFLPSNSYKVSYSASIGKSDLNHEEKTLLKKYLKKFDYLTVREDESVKCLDSLGLKSEHVLDPTLLLNHKAWKEIIKPLIPHEKYLVIYVMDYLYEDLIDIAVNVANKKKLKIYMIAFKKYKDPRINKQFTSLDPFNFLSIFDQASYVVTNSFHGVAFSINFNKQFIAVKKNKYNLRIESLLRTLGLGNRFVSRTSGNLEDIKDIDYRYVNNKLEGYREKSFNCIDEILSDYKKRGNTDACNAST